MLEIFNATLSPMLVLFLCIVIGFVLKKMSLLPDNSYTVMAKMENYVLVPALIINTFMNYCTVSSIADRYISIIYCVVILIVAFLISVPLSKVFAANDKYIRNIYKYALCFGNFSFMGNAIIPAILGEEALYKYMLFTLPLNIAVYTWGLMVLIPKTETKVSIFKNLCNPVVISIVIGALLGLTGTAKIVPDFVNTTIRYLSACMGPIAMILTGFVIGGYQLRILLKNKRVYFATAFRLVIFPMLFVTILFFLKADKEILVLAFFAFGTPLGLNTVVFPSAYGGDTKTGASMAMISHTLCVITIPLLYALISTLF